MIISQDPKLPLELNCPRMWICAVFMSVSVQGTMQDCLYPLKSKLVGHIMHLLKHTKEDGFFSPLHAECPTNHSDRISTASSRTDSTQSIETTSVVIKVEQGLGMWYNNSGLSRIHNCHFVLKGDIVLPGHSQDFVLVFICHEVNTYEIFIDHSHCAPWQYCLQICKYCFGMNNFDSQDSGGMFTFYSCSYQWAGRKTMSC